MKINLHQSQVEFLIQELYAIREGFEEYLHDRWSYGERDLYRAKLNQVNRLINRLNDLPETCEICTEIMSDVMARLEHTAKANGRTVNEEVARAINYLAQNVKEFWID